MHLQTEIDLLRTAITGDEMDFLVRSGNKAPELSVGDSDVDRAKESKTVNVKSESHVDHIP